MRTVRKKYRLPPYSVLMTVYDKELPANLNESLESMLMQTYPPDELVLVCDGKLTCELNIIAKSFESEFKDIIKIIRIDENVGAGMANNAGIKACRCPIIVKMDSDDISLPDRCAKQIILLATHPELDIVGTFIEEFNGETGETVSIKKMPVKQEQILKYARRRNPFNRQTVAFRKSAAESIGGYSDIRSCEDYEFIVRLLQSGAVGQNIPEPLVRYRISDENFKKRGSWKYTKDFIKVRRIIHKAGFSSFTDMLIPCAIQLGLFIMPSGFTRFAYKKILRK
ncbi:glycosyltransferase [Ruminococcus sp. Marseille-P6503]|uniref:glycosyltransferase n=1 Tax=Ruminococcus sp. Marseille-P6503 TaxID=2364796 RepID=UPI002432B382|nr:glycosyltransferase [Ruminococcus sp. Marseille-P6503]